MNSPFESNIDRIISKFVDFFYLEENKTMRWLLLFIIVGFILRLIAALNIGVLADDVLKASYSAGIMDIKTLSTSSHPPLFYYLTNLAYKIFGYTTFASRFWPLIFGTLLIPLSFLITRKFFGNKVALFSAFFVTFSTFLIRMTFTEESLVILFFAMFGVYFGLEYLDKRKTSLIILSATLFGLASLTKYSTPFFILSFLIFSSYYLKINNEKIFTKNNIKILILFLAIIFFFSLPFLTFNYLLYKDKGIVDIYFSRIVNLNSTQEIYGDLAGQDKTVFDNLLVLENYNNIFLPFKSDYLLSIFALFGIFLSFIKKKKRALFFIALFFIIPFVLQTGGSGLPKHFVFMPFILSIPAGFGLRRLMLKIKPNLIKIFLFFILIILLFNLNNSFGTPHNYLSSSDASQLKSFINQNVKEGDLIIFDSRIYTGHAFWLATDNHFLNLHEFTSFYQQNSQLHETNGINTNLYVIECMIDDCGWGWVNDKPEFNQSSEDILNSLKLYTQPVKIIKSFNYNGWNELFNKEKIEKYKIYSFNLNLNSDLVRNTDISHSFYFIPYLYKNKDLYFFNYTTYSIFDDLLRKLSYLIILISIFLSFISIILLTIFLKKIVKIG